MMSTERAIVRALLVPADEHRGCTVVLLPESAAGFSDAIGGGLLEEVHHGTVSGKRCFAVYGDEEREAKRLPVNARAAALLARLGWTDRAGRLVLRGDLLFVGADNPAVDTDVPPAILTVATRLGLLSDALVSGPA